MAKRIGSGGRPPIGSPPVDKCTQLNLTIPGTLRDRLENTVKMTNAQSRGQSKRHWTSGWLSVGIDPVAHRYWCAFKSRLFGSGSPRSGTFKTRPPPVSP